MRRTTALLVSVLLAVAGTSSLLTAYLVRHVAREARADATAHLMGALEPVLDSLAVSGQALVAQALRSDSFATLIRLPLCEAR